jgi:hypothetical protein
MVMLLDFEACAIFGTPLNNLASKTQLIEISQFGGETPNQLTTSILFALCVSQISTRTID